MLSNLSCRPPSPRVAFRTLLFLGLFFLLTGTAWFWQHQSPLEVTHISTHEPSAVPATVPAAVSADVSNATPTTGSIEPSAEPSVEPEPEEKDLPADRQSHPIDYLITTAQARFKWLLSKKTNDVAAAADAYRARRGRHPPPGFDKWFQFARDHDAVVIEDFFDQIYHDLAPFWAIDAKDIRQQAKHFPHVISVRDGLTNTTTDQDSQWMGLWSDLMSSIQGWLPDVDIPANVMDESRVIVPWEDINRYIHTERSSRKLVSLSKVVVQYTGLKELDQNVGEVADVKWITSAPYWDTAREGCDPNSLARNVSATTDFAGPPPMPTGFPLNSFDGYVQNWTTAKDPCSQPELRESHGTFVEPVSQSTTRSLIPVFGGSKLPMNNDILIPPAMYWSDDVQYSGGKDRGGEWEKKSPGLIWRGAGTGGRNKAINWTRFHRHRFVSMVNGTTVQEAERNLTEPGQSSNFVMLSYRTYKLAAMRHMDLGTWLKRISDAAFVNLECHPHTGNRKCPYTDPYFSVKDNVPMKTQYNYKYLPDLDGNSFSGRYLAFLRSTSVPIKATIYSEWHDSRLMPWLHFVPMYNSFVDVYGILDYFVGTGGKSRLEEEEEARETAHDNAGKKIALAGKEWAEKVLRKEDMQIYVMRLLMEYARICDDKREVLGYIDDLKKRMELD